MTTRHTHAWSLHYEGWDPREQRLREALTTLGNGRFATRGAWEEASADENHYPGTYLAGGYNRRESDVAGRIVENEDLVNWPNWLPLTFRIDDGPWFTLEQVDVLEYSLELDLLRGVLSRRVRFRDSAGRTSRLATQRIVHMALPHVAAIEWTLTPLDWCGTIEVRSGIDGCVTNTGVSRYRDLESKHLEVLETGVTGEDATFLVARTNQSRLVMAQAVRTHAFIGDLPVTQERHVDIASDSVAHRLVVRCVTKKPLRIEKVLSLSTSRDFAISEPKLEACKMVRRLPRFATLLHSHVSAWRYLWSRADMRLEAPDAYPQLVLRLHVFHLLQTTSVHTIDMDVGVPARGLHGEAYRGHVFWDELFIFPLLNLRLPELTRSLLMYRYRRLDEARHAAREAGFAGAMFPWQSGSDGREESQQVHLNPRSGRWLPDNTHRQRHVNGAIAYNIWQYYQATNDREFMGFHGVEMLLDIAHFFSSLAIYNPDRARYEIHHVVGPDEFHTEYPGSEGPGLNNNAYTNVMAAWVLRTAREALDLVSEDRRAELLETVGVNQEELLRWDDVSRRMFVPFHDDHIISQFEGWASLEELDWEGLKQRHGDVQRIDRLLEADGDDANRYKATKQADVLMLLYLFSASELGELFEHMGYKLGPGWIPHNVEYYLARTSHGSTLSRVVHAWVLSRQDRPRSWHLFGVALASDIDDVQGGTTSEGIHLGAMAGTVDLMQRAYTGIEMRKGVLWLDPQLPAELEALQLSLRYHGIWLGLQITHTELTVSFEKGWTSSACIGFRGEVYQMCQGESRSFTLTSA